MLLLNVGLLLVFQCVFSELFKSDHENDAKTINIWNILNTRRPLNSDSIKKKHKHRHHHSKKKPILRGMKNEMLDFFDCLRESQGDYYSKIISCLAQDNDISKIKDSASEALKKNKLKHAEVYQCFADMETKDDDKKHNAAQLMGCLTKPNVEKAINSMKIAKNNTLILTSFQKCMADSNKPSYEAKVMYCMDNNPDYFDKDLLQYLRINDYKMEYINKGYNDKWGIKMKFNSTIFLNSKEAVKGKRKVFANYNYGPSPDPGPRAAPHKQVMRLVNRAVDAVKKGTL